MGCGASTAEDTHRTTSKRDAGDVYAAAGEEPKRLLLSDVYGAYRRELLARAHRAFVSRPGSERALDELLQLWPDTGSALFGQEERGSPLALNAAVLRLNATAHRELLARHVPTAFELSDEVNAILGYAPAHDAPCFLDGDDSDAAEKELTPRPDGGFPLPQLGGAAHGGECDFEVERQLSEAQLHERLTFVTAFSKAPSSVASSSSRARRHASPAAPGPIHRRTDDVDEAVGYENAGYHAEEPSGERLAERVAKGVAKAALSGLDGTVADSALLVYPGQRGTTTTTTTSSSSYGYTPANNSNAAAPHQCVFSLTTASEVGSLRSGRGGECDSPSGALPNLPLCAQEAGGCVRCCFMLCGPLSVHAVALHQLVEMTGEAADSLGGLRATTQKAAVALRPHDVPGLAEDGRIGAETTPQLRCSRLQPWCCVRPGAPISALHVLEAGSAPVAGPLQPRDAELALSCVAEIVRLDARQLPTLRQWGRRVIPWLVAQYRCGGGGGWTPRRCEVLAGGGEESLIEMSMGASTTVDSVHRSGGGDANNLSSKSAPPLADSARGGHHSHSTTFVL